MSRSLIELPQELLALIFYHLPDPTGLSQVNRRLLVFSQDPYVRAHYFLTRYGKIQALYFAFARGKLLTPRVIDVLLASGAHLSRYLVQVAFHHFFHCQSHFLKPSMPWVRQLSLPAFSHFLKVASDKFHEIPRGKNEDDGALFAKFIKEAKLPEESRTVSWETIRDVFQKYLFMPFCHRDPLMSQFPLALAIEPRLLPYAVANGFEMDAKYRDFVFRKMFEKTSAPDAAHAEEIVANVRELCRLDTDMFVTRTVAAEVCLEAKTNEAAYRALKQLDRANDLPFSLPELVQDVIKLFLKARAITNSGTTQVLTQLYTDFLAPPPVPATFASALRKPPPPMDPTVRLTMFLTVFAADPPIAVSAMPARLAPLRLGPVSLKDAAGILLSAFIEKHTSVFEYLRREGVANETNEHGLPSASTRKVTHADLRGLAEDVAVRCLTKDSKGKTLKRLCEAYPTVRGKIVQAVLGEHEVKLEDLGTIGEAVAGGERVKAKLARDRGRTVVNEDVSDSEGEGRGEEDGLQEEEDDDVDMESVAGESEWGGDAKARKAKPPAHDLGGIGLEPLTAMIRRDEQGTRGRRRYFNSMSYAQTNQSSRVPEDSQSVAKWIKTEFGAMSSITATFLTHAVINENYLILSLYMDGLTPVPVTFKHFQILAQLGSNTGDFRLYDRIRSGAPFYRTEEDYLPGSDAARFLLKNLVGKATANDTEVKQDASQTSSSRVKKESVEPAVGSPSSHKRKRPRRSAAAAVSSYIVPDSDDEAIAAEEDKNDEFAEYRLGSLGGEKKKAKADSKEGKPKLQRVETDLQAWIKALEGLYKEEQGKYREKKKCMEKEKAAGNGGKIRVPKNDFFRSLTTNLRILRDLDAERRLHHIAAGGEAVESDEEDEYVQTKAPKAKRRKTIA
ncbi:hypothetical protein K438DRAFT_1693855 [Mycena galopus ATCC 62051]|nr:hypothetical protein K438DRAFT_1693855 [Mycena galopus ATCC 62051]